MHSASASRLLGPVNDVNWVACVSTKLATVLAWNQAGKIWQEKNFSLYKQHWIETLTQLQNSFKTAAWILDHSRSWNRGWKAQRVICRFHWNEDSIHVIFSIQEGVWVYDRHMATYQHVCRITWAMHSHSCEESADSVVVLLSPTLIAIASTDPASVFVSHKSKQTQSLQRFDFKPTNSLTTYIQAKLLRFPRVAFCSVKEHIEASHWNDNSLPHSPKETRLEGTSPIGSSSSRLGSRRVWFFKRDSCKLCSTTARLVASTLVVSDSKMYLT